MDNTDETLLIVVLAFGAVALAGTAAVAIIRNRLSTNFVKLFGLLFVATLATAIVFADIEDDTRTGAYTILGTIAGYLAGSRAVPSGEGGKKNKEAPARAAGTPPESSL